MNQQQITKKLLQEIDGAIERLQKAVGPQQQEIFKRVTLLVKELETSGDTVKVSVKNLRMIARIKAELEQIVATPEWKAAVGEYVQSFETVTKLQNQYFQTLKRDFKPSPLLNEIKAQSIDAATNSLLEAGINQTITVKLQDILRQNITTGGSYSQLLQRVREFTLNTNAGDGALQRYSKQITTDALNQYAAQYTNAVTNDLGLEWFTYNGALIDTSRAFCVALINKKYIHKSELPSVILGKFKEFEDADGKINTKTGLPEGMIAGTNAANFHIYRGGWQCGHQLLPVAETLVPYNVRIEVYNREGIAYDEKGFAIKGAPPVPKIKEKPVLNFSEKLIDKIKIAFNQKASSIMQESGVTKKGLLNLVGGIPINNISNPKFHADGFGNKSISARVDSDEYTIIRNIDYELMEIYNAYMVVNKTGSGIGTKLLANQIIEARKQGFKRFSVSAAKSDEYNGYYTWARMGYGMKEADQKRFKQFIAKHGRDEEDIFELMATEEGQQFWKENGFGFEGEFDLSDGSINMFYFKAYLKEKGMDIDL